MTEDSVTPASELIERTVPGLHDAVIEVIRSRLRPGLRAVDLGTGTGAFAARLERLGCRVIACDIDSRAYRGPSELKRLDLDHAELTEELGPTDFQLVAAIEVIEHLEAPIRFLHQIRSLLHPEGFAVLTTPNVDSLPAKAKFLLKGTLRMFDEWGDPTHISPIFWDLLVRKYLPRTRLQIAAHTVYPEAGFVAGRDIYRELMSLMSPVIRRNHRAGDNHILVLTPR
jgi:2-polyprenyl-3-methyl-5-hydroxy-6-metoxy-1,4-benzoquinol methylase